MDQLLLIDLIYLAGNTASVYSIDDCDQCSSNPKSLPTSYSVYILKLLRVRDITFYGNRTKNYRYYQLVLDTTTGKIKA
jgi:hypothetical protein